MMEAERQSGSGLDAADFATVGSRHSRKRRDSHHSDSESDEDELRSLDDFPVETSYVIQQEEEFGSVFLSAPSVVRCCGIFIILSSSSFFSDWGIDGRIGRRQ